MYVMITSYVNWHMENLRLDRENTGKFEKTNLSGYPVYQFSLEMLPSYWHA